VTLDKQTKSDRERLTDQQANDDVSSRRMVAPCASTVQLQDWVTRDEGSNRGETIGRACDQGHDAAGGSWVDREVSNAASLRARKYDKSVAQVRSQIENHRGSTMSDYNPHATTSPF